MATANPFKKLDKIRVSALDQKRSAQWYQDQIRKLGTQRPETYLKATNQLENRVLVGSMYLFMYDPKTKETLPYYDTFPLIFPFKKAKGGFYGINLHYLNYGLRLRLMGALTEYSVGQNEDRRLALSWKLLTSAAKLKPVMPCVKRYLNDHVQSRFLKVDPNDWIIMSMLPIERFESANKNQVWRDSARIV